MNKDLRLQYDSVKPPYSRKGTVDSIIIYPKSRGILRLGKGFSRGERHPRYTVRVSSVYENLVKWEEDVLIEDSREYVLVHAYNRNESPAFVSLEVRA